MRRPFAIAADLVFPRDCPACERALPLGHPGALCVACHATLEPSPDPRCDRCGIPTPPPRVLCGACVGRPPAYDTARALGLYLAEAGTLNPLAAAVRALKYRGCRPMGTTLGDALAVHYPFAADALVVPVPLHPARLRERGYNQAVLLARALARRRRLDVDPRALARTRPTPVQAGLTAAARRANLRAAFAVRPTARLARRTVVLVDDVLTTGATADACAAALRAAGAARVDVYTVGRTPSPALDGAP
jgi:ComF family protein